MKTLWMRHCSCSQILCGGMMARHAFKYVRVSEELPVMKSSPENSETFPKPLLQTDVLIAPRQMKIYTIGSTEERARNEGSGSFIKDPYCKSTSCQFLVIFCAPVIEQKRWPFARSQLSCPRPDGTEPVLSTCQTDSSNPNVLSGGACSCY